MDQLSDVIGSAGSKLLQAKYRVPSITGYNRLEPRPRTENFERSLRAEVRDALWMLTRQWQMGEFESEDAGSAVDARLLTRQIHIDRVALEGNVGRQYDKMIPLETMVEAETIDLRDDLNAHIERYFALKVQIGQYFLQLHTPELKARYMVNYLREFGFDQNKEDRFAGQIDGLSLYIATKGRAINGGKLYQAVLDGTFKTSAGIESADDADMNVIIGHLKTWFERQYFQPAKPGDSAWHPRQLEYQFSVAAPQENGAQTVLRANQYHQGKLDWYAFDVEPEPTPLNFNRPFPLTKVEESSPISYLPHNVSFKGMPNPRFWEMEDRQINFGKLNAKTTDHLLLFFTEFGLIYDNDWFVIPYKLPVNTLCEIEGLVITDVFGDRTSIQAADEGADSWQRWSMFNLSNKGKMGHYDRQFFLPATLAQTLESEPIEKVSFIKDEMANMVWGIEDIIPDATCKGINGHEAADKTGVEPPTIEESTANIRYLLGTTVPENWIPFIPVHKPGSNQETYFQRAAMPKLGDPPKDVIKAKGILLNEVQPTYYINEEELLYSGTIVTRTYQRTRWYNGKTYLWIGRYKETGKGEGSSNLRFDQIEPI